MHTDTPRRYGIANVNKCLELLEKMGHKNGEKYMDYIKITENEKDEEKTTQHLMREEEVVQKAVEAYWEEMANGNAHNNG